MVLRYPRFERLRLEAAVSRIDLAFLVSAQKCLICSAESSEFEFTGRVL